MFIRKLNEGVLQPLNTNFSYELKYYNVQLLAETFNESPVGVTRGDDPARLVFILMQQQDLYTALRYAEEEIISGLQQGKFDEFTEGMVFGWVMGIHARAAKTIVEDIGEGYKAGEFSRDIMLITRISIEFSRHFLRALDGEIELQAVLEQYHVSVPHAQLIALIHKIKNDTRIECPVPQARMAPNLHFLQKVSYGTEQGFVTKEEAGFLDQVLCIKRPPETYHAQMKKFASDLVLQLKSWDRSRRGAIKIAAFAFQGITFIHGLPNGNYRTGSTLSNAILAGLINRTMVLRTGAAATDETSEYRKMLKQLDQSLESLEHYIESKLDEQEMVSSVQAEFNRLVFSSKQPLYAKLDEILKKIQSATKAGTAYEWGEEVQKVAREFDRMLTKNGVTFYLEKVTGQAGWKGNCKDEYKFWLSDLTPSEASELVQRLHSLLDSCPEDDKPIVSLRHEQVTKKPLVLIDDAHKNVLHILRTGYEVYHKVQQRPDLVA